MTNTETLQQVGAAPLPQTAADWLEQVQLYEAKGELFHAYDAARRGLEQFPADLALKHRAVLCLASTGATQQAVKQFAAFGLDSIDRDVVAGLSPRLGIDIASLSARLLKDEALTATGNIRRTKIAAAASAYEAIYREAKRSGNPNAYYPGINSAMLRLLSGDGDTATTIAQGIREQISARDANGYYELATLVEACLITGDVVKARQAARQIRQLTHRSTDLRALASTIHQQRAIVATTGIGFDPVAELAPPRVVHYLGHIIAAPGGNGRFPAEQEQSVMDRIVAKLDAAEVAIAYGSLAAGADILFAEALLERGASLNVVLPFDAKEFVEISVRPAGAHWVDQFHRCYDRAATIHLATTDRYLSDDTLFGYCGELAMGLALLRADHLCSPVEQIAVWDGNPPLGPAGSAIEVELWRRTQMPQTIIPIAGGALHIPAMRSYGHHGGRSVRAMLFGDIKGFSKLNDTQLPAYVDTVLGAFGRVIEQFAGEIQLANTWGDGLFLVFEDAGVAATCALALQEAMAAIDLAAAGLPETMALRVGGHLGPVYRARDPILKRDNFFGTHVSRAARIEPVTPEGLVYVTEPLAAVLALHNADEFPCHYVGMTKVAKDYGEMRMFLLAPNSR